jgi:mRNA-degrading endonuclease RelE of RelBE toxin-antitoxin system
MKYSNLLRDYHKEMQKLALEQQELFQDAIKHLEKAKEQELRSKLDEGN